MQVSPSLRFFFITASVLMVIFFLLVIALVFGGPKTPVSLAVINTPFKSVDFSDLPPTQYFSAGDGTLLAFRQYSGLGTKVKGSVVLVHGSSASSESMHSMAKAFAYAGYSTFALDIRGHGHSGPKGVIHYVGQLEDDLKVFTQSVVLAKPSTLVGFSSGGGFVLRIAGSDLQTIFQNYLLLSPYLGYDAPNYKPDSGGWVDVGIPRVLALSLLNALGIEKFNHLPVTRFALNEEAKKCLTTEYSFALASNFQAKRDYQANIRAAHQPCSIVAGAEDEVFYTDRLEAIFQSLGKYWAVTLVPGIGHIPLILETKAVDAAVNAVEAMNSRIVAAQ